MRTIRVFPRRTKATPADPLAYVGSPDLFAQADRVEISVSFTWDLPTAERLAEQWERVAPVAVGGPATGQPAADFTPGKYLRRGYTITSRGCPNCCPHCQVWRREDGLRELPIADGWIVQDDNLLACSEAHIRAVFAMLGRQRERVTFAGGLEAPRLRAWHAELLATLRPRPRVFLAYDGPDDLEPMIDAAAKLRAVGFTPQAHGVRAYVLAAYPGDTIAAAEARLVATVRAGITPFAMLYRAPVRETVEPTREWRELQRRWARAAIIHARRAPQHQ